MLVKYLFLGSVADAEAFSQFALEHLEGMRASAVVRPEARLRRTCTKGVHEIEFSCDPPTIFLDGSGPDRLVKILHAALAAYDEEKHERR